MFFTPQISNELNVNAALPADPGHEFPRKWAPFGKCPTWKGFSWSLGLKPFTGVQNSPCPTSTDPPGSTDTDISQVPFSAVCVLPGGFCTMPWRGWKFGAELFLVQVGPMVDPPALSKEHW